MKTQVKPEVLNLILEFYGNKQVARDAYRVVRDQVKLHNRTKRATHGGQVIWCNGQGRLVAKGAAEVQYKGSIDAHFVLPLV